MALKMAESSFSLAGVGRELRADGGGRGLRGPGILALIDDMPRGGKRDEACDEPDMCPNRGGGPAFDPLRNRGGARGGGVMARRVTGCANGVCG